MQTVKSALTWGEQQLTGKASPKLDCEILLKHALDKSRTFLYTYPEHPIEDAIWSSFQQLVEQRKQGKPVAYIIGEKEFWSLNFKVTPDVLIPRPDTELLVEQAIKHRQQEKLQVVDLGTGSGAIACAVAKSCPQWQVIATDFSQACLDIAQYNCQKHRLLNVSFVLGEWLEPFKANSFDLIISNPPYIDPIDPHLQDPELGYEPITALKADKQGLACLQVITQQATSRLKPSGWLMLEHGFTQGAQVRAMMQQAGFKHIQTLLDIHGQERVTQGQIESIF